jgi:hypothetical protein
VRRIPRGFPSEAPRGSASIDVVPPRPAAAIDADEEALESKMIEHDLAGRTTLARGYERALEKLRAAKAAGNVVSMRARRT